MKKLFLIMLTVFLTACVVPVFAEVTFYLEDKPQLRISWTQPVDNIDGTVIADNQAWTIASNLVEYSIDGGTNWTRIIIDPAATEYFLQTASIGYADVVSRIAACNVPLICSAWSNEVVAHLIPKPTSLAPVQNEME